MTGNSSAKQLVCTLTTMPYELCYWDSLVISAVDEEEEREGKGFSEKPGAPTSWLFPNNLSGAFLLVPEGEFSHSWASTRLGFVTSGKC